MKFYDYKPIYVVIIISILFAATGLRADERVPASEAFSEGTKEFLSDPARTGSLLGSILAGAAVANPLAPLLGSVAGFMIGKSSAFSKNDNNAARRNAYMNRSLIPEDGENGPQVIGLAGLTGKPPQASEQTANPGLSEGAVMGNLSDQSQQVIIVGPPEEREAENQSDQAVILDVTRETQAGSNLQLQKQLAYACSNSQANQQLSSRCYYYSR